MFVRTDGNLSPFYKTSSFIAAAVYGAAEKILIAKFSGDGQQDHSCFLPAAEPGDVEEMVNSAPITH